MNFFTSNGLRLTYRIDGPHDAPAIVMINSLGTDLRMWEPQIAYLSPTLRVVRYDFRGHGSSDVPAEPFTIDRLGLDLLALLDTLQIERAHICGLSLGGMTALWFSAHYPDRVNHAVFANTGARIGTVEIWNARIDAVRTGGMAAIRDTVLARFLSEAFRRSHPEVVQRFGETLEAINPLGYIGACSALRNADLRNMLSAIHAPSLILVGELDQSTPPTLSQELHVAIPGSELIIFPQVAHLSNVEQPEEFSKSVLNFLKPH